MYTLERVLDLDLDPDTRIESYGIDYDEDGVDCLALHLA